MARADSMTASMGCRMLRAVRRASQPAASMATSKTTTNTASEELASGVGLAARTLHVGAIELADLVR